MPFDGAGFDQRSALLIAARERVERGWSHGSGRSRDGVCSIVALSDAADDLGLGLEVFLDAHMLLAGVVGGCVSDWNDAPGRTKGEVLAVFDRAIAWRDGG